MIELETLHNFDDFSKQHVVTIYHKVWVQGVCYVYFMVIQKML